MRRSMYAVRDSAAQCFGQPFVAHSNGIAMRSFRDEVNNPQSQMSKHPSDYELYIIGEYEEDTGGISAVNPECLLRGKDCVETVQ